jgi:predicted ATPase
VGLRVVREVRVAPGPMAGHPFDLPVVRWLAAHGLRPGPGATLLTGENGSGKSTLLEAVAVASGLNAEGGSKSFRFATDGARYPLADRLEIAWTPGRRGDTYFLRGESVFTLATEIARLGAEDSYGGDLRVRSHGESVTDLVRHRLTRPGVYLLDEPEGGLSPLGCLSLLRMLHDLVGAGSQLLVATHSPLLLALPGAAILQVEADGRLRPVGYDAADAVVRTRDFLAAPDRTLRHLLD